MTASVRRKACHTPEGPETELKRKAAGRITTVYLHRDMMREANPFPIPYKAKDEVTDTDDIIKPALIMRRALAPSAIVSGLPVKNDMSASGTN